jgi:HAD superfamily hydrolase (TIGR01509 family)
MTRTGLIFDFDGVIVLSEPVHVRAWRDLESHFDRRLPPRFAEDGIGRSDSILCDELAAAWDDGPSATAILAAKRRFYQGRAEKESELVPGVKEALAHFAERFPISLATSSCRADIDPHFERHGLRVFFRSIMTVESITRPKPDPEIYVKAAASLGLEPGECWVFEDSIQGANAARAAGAGVIGLTTTLSAESLAPVEAAFSDFLDLESIARRLQSGD